MKPPNETEDRMAVLMERIQVGEIQMRLENVKGHGFDGGAQVLIFTAAHPQAYGEHGRLHGPHWKNRIKCRVNP